MHKCKNNLIVGFVLLLHINILMDSKVIFNMDPITHWLLSYSLNFKIFRKFSCLVYHGKKYPEILK